MNIKHGDWVRLLVQAPGITEHVIEGIAFSPRVVFRVEPEGPDDLMVGYKRFVKKGSFVDGIKVLEHRPKTALNV